MFGKCEYVFNDGFGERVGNGVEFFLCVLGDPKLHNITVPQRFFIYDASGTRASSFAFSAT